MEDIPGSGRKQYLGIKVLEIKAVQRHSVLVEEMFELRCRFLCSAYCAVKHVSELGWTFIYLSSFSSLTLPHDNALAHVSFVIWQENVVIKMFLSKSVHLTAACFIQFCVLWLVLEVKITGACSVLEQPFLLSKGRFCILSQALWDQNLSLGVLVVFNNCICIDGQYLS